MRARLGEPAAERRVLKANAVVASTHCMIAMEFVEAI